MNVTMLECIEQIPSVLKNIIATRKEKMEELFSYLGDGIKDLEQIVLVGSGTSNTSTITASYFTEKVSGVEVKAVFPSTFLYDTHKFNEKALYVFISQTGTSKLTRNAQKLVIDKGYWNVSISESNDTPIAKESDCFLDMGCGYEEQPMRTIGYSSTVLTIMLMGLEIGLRKGNITKEEYDKYIADASNVPESIEKIIPATLDWMQKKSEWQIMRSPCIVFTGSSSLYGAALEGAVKIWETPKVTSIGYELEEGMHGPNFGYNSNHCVIVFNDGGRDNQKALSLARYMKDVFKNGLVVGSSVVDDNDLKLDLKGGDFNCLEIVTVPQVMAHKLATDMGRDLLAPHNNSAMFSYFSTHSSEGDK